MRDQRNRNARRKRLARQLLRLAGLALAAAVVVFVAIRVVNALRSSGGGAASGSAGSQDAVSGEPAEYASLTYENGTATLRFLYLDGAWVWQDVPDFPLVQADVDAVTEALAGLAVRQTVTDFESLADYELDSPNYLLTLTWTDGREESLAIGKATDNGDGRYVLRDGDESTLYIVTDSLTALLDRPIYSMMRLPETVELAESQLTAVTYTAGETELRLVSSASGDAVTWRYGNQDVTETVQSAVAVLCAWDVERCVDYEPSHDAAVLCGFGSPTARIDIEYLDAAGAQQTLRYTVGGAVPGGDGRCLRIGDDRSIFAVTAESAGAVLALGSLAAPAN